MKLRKALLLIVISSIIILILDFLLPFALPQKYIFSYSFAIALFFMIYNLLQMLFLVKVCPKFDKNRGVIMGYLVSSMLKFLIICVFILVFSRLNKESVMLFAIYTMAYYFYFLVFEIYALLKFINTK